MKRNITLISATLLLIWSVKAQNINLDSSFDIGKGANKTVNTIAVQPDGKILIGGIFDQFDTKKYLTLKAIRLLADGSIDTSFQPPTSVIGEVSTIRVQPDGKILLFGAQIYSTTRKLTGVVRLNADGSIDELFNANGNGFGGSVKGGLVQPDGRILVYGTFNTHNGVSCGNNIARLNSDGSRDETFNPGTGFNLRVDAVALQPDGKILAGGLFKKFNGVDRNYIARLNADGTLDTSFDAKKTFTDDVRSIVVQNDGKIICGGNLKENFPAGVVKPRIARLNSDGTVDGTFNPGIGFNSYPLAFYIQEDNKIIVAGDFGTYQNIVVGGIARLLPDATLDTSFKAEKGFTRNKSAGGLSYINTMAMQADGKILLGGNFEYFDDIAAPRVARIYGDLNFAGLNDKSDGTVGFNLDPAHSSLTIRNLPSTSNVRIYNVTGGLQAEYLITGEINTIRVAGWTAGVYVIHVESNNSILLTEKFILNPK